MKPGPFPPEVCSLVTLLKMYLSVLIPMNKCDKHHTQGIKATITAWERGGGQEKFLREVSTKSGVYRWAGYGYSRVQEEHSCQRGQYEGTHRGRKIQSVLGGNDKRFESQHSPSTCIGQDGKMWSLPTRSSHVSREVARENIAAVFAVDHGHFLNLRAPLFMGPSKAPGRIPVCLLQVELFCKVLMSKIYYLQRVRTTVYFHSDFPLLYFPSCTC